MIPCSQVQQVIIEEGTAGLRAQKACRDHIADCETCFDFLEAYVELNPLLQSLPTLQPADILVQKTLESIAKKMSQPEFFSSPDPIDAENKSPALILRKPPFQWRRFLSLMRAPFVLSSVALVLVAFFAFLLAPRNFGRQHAPRVLAQKSMTAPSPKRVDEGASMKTKQHRKPKGLYEEDSHPDQEMEALDMDNSPEMETPDRDNRSMEGELEIIDDAALSGQQLAEDIQDGLLVNSKDASEEQRQDLQAGSKLRNKRDEQDTGQTAGHSEPAPSIPEHSPGYSQDRFSNAEGVISIGETDNVEKVPFNDKWEEAKPSQLTANKKLPRSRTNEDQDRRFVAGAQSLEKAYQTVQKQAETFPASSEEELELEQMDEWEIGIPDASGGDTIARVGQVGVEPPVFTKRVIPRMPEAALGSEIHDTIILEAVLNVDGSITDVKIAKAADQEKFGFEELALQAFRHWEFLPGSISNRPFPFKVKVQFTFQPEGVVSQESFDVGSMLNEPNHVFLDFFEMFTKTDNLSFIEPVGYWRNTYLPGDSNARTLLAQVEQLRQTDPQFLGQVPLLARVQQPFDAPENSALSLHLNSSQSWVNGPNRMLLQVGIAASERSSGHRPALHLGLVLDIPDELDPNTIETFLSILEAFNQSKDLTDRFTLVLAGRPGGEILQSEDFRRGALTILRQQLWGQREWPERDVFSLEKALRSAANAVVKSSRDSIQMGNPALILITSRDLPDIKKLEKWVHKKALNGIRLSAFGVGSAIVEEQINKLILAGQGNRRFLSTPQEAPRAVNAEIASVSRVVAKAIRLNIRLGPDTRLVSVLGSDKLTQSSAKRVREAEKSIDRRISQTMGIQSDRGEDDAGIQIVIPNFYAGDTHVILLDVVSDKPGTQMSVDMKYKDLVFLRNGSSRSNLVCSRNEVARGPMEYLVLKNALAFEVSKRLDMIGLWFRCHDNVYAKFEVENLILILRGYQDYSPFFSDDIDFNRDLNLLRNLHSMLESPQKPDNVKSEQLAKFLNLSSNLKTKNLFKWE